MTDSLQETIDLLINEVLGKFNFDYFKNLSRTNVRPTTKQAQMDMMYSGKTHPEIEYASAMLPALGAGSGRTVYALSGGKALKIAKNEKGVAQNKAEVDISQSNPNSPYVTRTFDFSPDYKWIVAEISKPMNKSEFEQFTQVPQHVFALLMDVFRKGGSSPETAEKNFAKYAGYLSKEFREGEVLFQLPLGGNKKIKDYLGPLQKALKDKAFMDWFLGFLAFGKANDFDFGDVVPDHFGRTVDGRVVLFDYGLTNEVWSSAYETNVA